MELYEKIYVAPAFLKTEHGEISCQGCHGGNPDDGNWQTAHQDLVKDPSFLSADRICGECHPDITASAVKSLHYTLTPMYEAVRKRSAPGDAQAWDGLNGAMERHCGVCHASCGQCHVSRPDYVKGGSLSKHVFVKTPSMDTICAACHGGRVYAEFTGDNEDLSPDLHLEDEEMACTDCHSGDEMHADGTGVDNRYELSRKPSCRQCHEGVFSTKGTNRAHTSHKGKLDCRVCHAQAYKNCFSCHVGRDKKGLPYFKCKKTGYDFKIGLNPEKTESRPYEFVLVRHVPVVLDTFKFYGVELDRFDAHPTWKPASPHTVLKTTPQNETCNNCHGNASLFLGAGDLAGHELTANKKIIVPLERVPEKIPDE